MGCSERSNLLKVSLKFLKEHKRRLKINKITLVDMAQKECFGKKIKFSDVYIILQHL